MTTNLQTNEPVAHEALPGPPGAQSAAAGAPPDTLAQQVRLLYESSFASQMLVLLASGLFVLVQKGSQKGEFLAFWLAAFVAVTFARLALLWCYRTRSERLPTRVWRDLFAVGAALAGIAWGVASTVFLGSQEMLAQVTVVFVVAGLVAAGVPYLSPVPLAVYAFVVPALLPTVVLSLNSGDGVRQTLGVMTIVFGVAMIIAARFINRQMVQTFQLRNENVGLVDYLRRVNRQMVSVNAQLSAEIGDRKEVERNLQYVAAHDYLTGLPNRQQFSNSLRDALQKAERHGRKFGVFFIDIDRFKNINDTLGHHSGDRVLVEIAARLSACVREADIVGRFGGDEFVVLLDEVRDFEDCARVAQKVLEGISSTTYGLDGQNLHLTASIGISTYPADGADIHSLLKHADIAMYRAKEKGKNAFEYYSAAANRHTVERLSLEADLRDALERGQFVLAYQPKFSLAETRAQGVLVGVEALLRWRHPLHGLVSPAKFIPLAEESGLIVPIGKWVLETACAQAAAWRASGVLAPGARMAVNISPRQFAHERLLDHVFAALDVSGLPGDRLEIEITEGTVMHNVDRAMGLLAQLRNLDVQVSIDDFGTGYSSLSSLKRFPISRIKIDKSFVDEVASDPDDAAITRTIIAMAHNLRLKAIAEGVETEEQLAFLREHGCDEVQGYLTGRPQFAEEFVAAFGAASGPMRAAGDVAARTRAEFLAA